MSREEGWVGSVIQCLWAWWLEENCDGSKVLHTTLRGHKDERIKKNEKIFRKISVSVIPYYIWVKSP